MRLNSSRTVFVLVSALLLGFFTAVQAQAVDCTYTSTVDASGYTILEFTSSLPANNISGFQGAMSCTWKVPIGVSSISVVIVGGGGSGGFGNQGGGGGGGQVLYTQNDLKVISGSIQNLVIGSGGWPTSTQNSPGNDGAASSFNGITANGGGGGGGGGPLSGAINFGRTGGSAGGGNRFGVTATSATLSTPTGWVALGSAGGVGAGRQDNSNGVANSAGTANCYIYGAGGGGGGAMSVGQSGIATCTGSRASDTVVATGGSGGAGAYIFGRCLGGGGASGAVQIDTNNLGTKIATNASTVDCLDVNSRASVAGSQSGSGYGYLEPRIREVVVAPPLQALDLRSLGPMA